MRKQHCSCDNLTLVVKCFRYLYSSVQALHRNTLEFRCFSFRSSYIQVAAVASSVLIIQENLTGFHAFHWGMNIYTRFQWHESVKEIS